MISLKTRFGSALYASLPDMRLGGIVASTRGHWALSQTSRARENSGSHRYKREFGKPVSFNPALMYDAHV